MRARRLSSFSDDVIADMVARYVSGESQTSIARTYGLDQPTVSHLVRPHAPPERSRRRAHGTTNGAGKLTDDQVRHIRSSFDTGAITQVSLARQHDISPSTVHGIIKGKTHSPFGESTPN
ncbi:hypothetical protein R3Q06_35105 [Rhodococcus erythropolis]|uniref:hypothetical protein n=1 Tax=Rhodococcus erythropolis TaxID=1833 RepID=UPI00294A425E|nr:hypothetical protein [Rhodococcus erythropolis]MDV6278617.1 hypothetical protein [Rhodococcus erythropolis]